MRRGSYALAFALMGAVLLTGSSVSAQPYSERRPGAQMDVGAFYDELSPYGDWVEMEDYGWSWAPRVDRGWRPYTRGQWVMTDDGWYWDSDERFGWAAYHYGRWVNDRYYGWIWIPGTEWAPAWVSWRHGNGYTGWAPLPPRVGWRSRIGLSIGGLDIDAYIGSNDYSFVRDRSFVDRGIYQRVLPPTQNVTIINVTNNITNYTVENDRVVNRGVDVGNVERAVGRRVPHARTVDVDRVDAPRRSRAGEVAVYRPEVREGAAERRPAHGRSLVKGDAPPPQLAERRRQREQESRQKGTHAEVTAKDVQERQAPPRAESQQQQRLEREQRQAAERQQREQVKAPREDARAQQQEKQRAQQQEAQRERAAAREEGEKQRAAGQEQQRVERAQRQAEQQQRAQQQKAPREDGRAQQQEAQRERAAARQEGEKQRAEGQNQQRAEREQRQANEQQQRAQQQAERQRAKETQREENKDKGKKKAKPSPPPEGQQP